MMVSVFSEVKQCCASFLIGAAFVLPGFRDGSPRRVGLFSGIICYTACSFLLQQTYVLPSASNFME